jgi:hypothetical protein
MNTKIADTSMKIPERWKSCVKGRFYFEIAPHARVNLPPGESPPNPFRDPAAPFVLREISTRLRDRGYNVSEPKQGKGCFVVRALLPTFKLSVMLSVQREKDCARFLLWSGPHQGQLFRKTSLFPSDLADWGRFCDSIENILTENLGVTSLRRVTHEEAFRK